jgi:hypothetical protein
MARVAAMKEDTRTPQIRNIAMLPKAKIAPAMTGAPWIRSATKKK